MISLLILSNRVKKIESNVDNCSVFSEKRYQMIFQIQKFLKEGCSYREISKRMGVGRNTIAKYREGDPKELSMFGIRQSKLDPYYDFIIQCLASGWSKSKTVKAIYEKGYSGSTSNAFEQLRKIEKKKYSNSSIKALKSFAEGLKRDIDAVENAVAYNFSNGFVEGTNSRLKMIKRSMYGRCGKQLLEAKLRYTKSSKNG